MRQDRATSLEVAPSSKVEPDGPMRLRDFLRRTGATLRARWPASLWVECAVIGCRPARAGHVLELVDAGPGQADDGQLRAFVGAADLAVLRAAAGLAFEPAHLVGMTAVLLLAPEFHVRWHVQARVGGIAGAMGDGLARRMRADAKAALVAEGLWGRQRRLAAPADVTRVAVVHPPGGAGHDDVERELLRWRAAGLVVTRSHPAAFEGNGAAAAVAAALRAAAEPLGGARPDLVLLVRGGGPRSGLLKLDEAALARAVASAGVPVVTGLGHAGDVSLADEVAWCSTDTPSKAAALVRSLIVEPARRAIACKREIDRLAGERIGQAAAALDKQRSRVAAGGQGLASRQAARLAAASAMLASGAASAACPAMRSEAGRRLASIAGSLRDVLDLAGGAASARLDDASRAAIGRLGAADGGGALAATVRDRGDALAERRSAQVDALLEECVRGAATCSERCGASLAAAAALVDALDPLAVLRRGYALVFDRAGGIVKDRSRACAAGALVVRFRDGDLSVVVGSGGAYGGDGS